MTTPSIVPTRYLGTDADYYQAPGKNNGSVQPVQETVSVPDGTAFTTVVGLVPFRKGASFHAPTFYCGDFGGGSTTASFGIVYDDNSTYTNDVDLFASASTAPQSGGYVTLDEPEWLDFVTEADGWVAMTINTANADATANVICNLGIAYNLRT